MAFRFKRHLDTGTLDHVIPRDYVHVFLVRNPERATPSFYKMNLDRGNDLLDQARADQLSSQCDWFLIWVGCALHF